MAQVSQYHITFESPEYFGEADVEVSFTVDDDGYEFIDKETIQYDNIVLTSKATGKSEFASQVPDEIENCAIEAADDQFKWEE